MTNIPANLYDNKPTCGFYQLPAYEQLCFLALIINSFDCW